MANKENRITVGIPPKAGAPEPEVKFTGWSTDFMENYIWDFSQVEPQNLEEYAQVLMKFIEFVSFLGWVEHTSDWDPVLIIEFKDGTHATTPSHYYEVKDVKDGKLFVESPLPEDYEEWDEEVPENYDPEKGYLVYELKDIKTIIVDPQ